MKTIFLVGHSNTVLKSIYKMLSGPFHVQITADEVEVVKGNLQITRPDLIVVCMADINDGEGILQNIRENYKTIPVLLVGSKEEIAAVEGCTDSEQFQILYRPVATSEILKSVQGILGTEGSGQELLEDTGISPEDGNKKTILLVDDSAIQLRMLKGILQQDFHVEMAKSGEAALKIIERGIPDLIFLDYDMPEQDGRTVFGMIQKYEPAAKVPVVFLTGVNDRERIQAVLALKPAGYMLKPVDQETLMQTIKDILGKKSE